MFTNSKSIRPPWLAVLAARSGSVILAIVLLSCAPKEGKDANSLEAADSSPDGNIPAMLTGDWVPADPHQIDFDHLPEVPSEYGVVSDVRDAGGTRVNQHNYLVHFDGKFWAMWSDGPGEARAPAKEHRNVTPGHDRADQYVSFATSADGLKWSAKGDIAGAPEKGYGWIARGFWVRDGKLLALASRYKAPGYAGEGLQLHAFEMQPGAPAKWKHLGMASDNAMNNFPPKQLATGEWMMSRRDSLRNVYFMVGGTKSFDDWESFPIVNYENTELAAEEPHWWTLPDGKIMSMFRDNKGSGYLFRAFSGDNGRTWTTPERTNFPDAKSKFSGLRLQDGRYVIVSNPDPKKRDPLAVAVSDDGLSFSKMAYLVGGRKVDYPHVIEHEGNLYVAFASAKQTVEVLKVKLADLDNVQMTFRKANN